MIWDIGGLSRIAFVKAPVRESGRLGNAIVTCDEGLEEDLKTKNFFEN